MARLALHARRAREEDRRLAPQLPQVAEAPAPACAQDNESDGEQPRSPRRPRARLPSRLLGGNDATRRDTAKGGRKAAKKSRRSLVLKGHRLWVTSLAALDGGTPAGQAGIFFDDKIFSRRSPKTFSESVGQARVSRARKLFSEKKFSGRSPENFFESVSAERRKSLPGANKKRKTKCYNRYR